MPGSNSVTAAVANDGMATVFYVDRHDNIAIYHAQALIEKVDGGKLYINDFVYEGDPAQQKNLKAGNKNLSALSYWDFANSRINTRLYWVDKDQRLQELCKDGQDGQWYRGALGDIKNEDNKDIIVMQGTTLCAMRQIEGGDPRGNAPAQLKVFYIQNEGDHGRLAVAYITSGSSKWEARYIE